MTGARLFPQDAAGWLDKEREEYRIDLRKFGPHVYYRRGTFREFLTHYPDQVQTLPDESVVLTMTDYWVRCWLDAAGEPERLVVGGRFRVQFDDPAKHPRLAHALMSLLELDKETAEQAVRDAQKAMVGWETPLLCNLEKREAIRLCKGLQKCGIPGRVVPLYTCGEGSDGGGPLSL